MKQLILLDTDRVKDYVFGSYKLREVRGASALLDYSNRVRSPDVLQQIELESTLYSHGGTTMGILSSTDAAARGIRALEHLYRQQSAGGASITGSCIGWNGEEGEPFRNARRELALKVRLAKEQREATPASSLALPVFHFCQSCGGVPAGHIDPTDRRVVCAACRLKRRWSEYVRDRGLRIRQVGWDDTFLDRLGRWLAQEGKWAGERGLEALAPEDLNDIGEVSRPRNYVGFIYCDANSLGRILHEPPRPQALQDLAVGIDQRLREVTFSALTNRLPPRPRAQGKVLPFEIVLLGGDDLVLITAADQALDVAAEIVQAFTMYTADAPVTLSAGVVLAHASFPIAAFFRLASELLKLAKRKRVAERWEGGALDFAVVSSSGAPAVYATRQQEWRANIGTSTLYLSERPYPMSPRDAHTQPSFPALLSAVRDLKAVNVPRSRLHYLYEALFDSMTQTEVQATRVLQEIVGHLSNQNARECFLRILRAFSLSPPPWRDAGSRLKTTPFLDLLELWDFVPEEAKP